MNDEAPETLLEKLLNCPVNFDPTADHIYGTEKPAKIAFVPVELMQKIACYLKETADA